MVFVIDQKFVDMWNKHCDVLTCALLDNFIRLEKYIKEEVVFKGFDISSHCSCINLDEYIGRCSTEFLDFKHILTYEFRGYNKSDVALRVKVIFDYEKDSIPFCFNFMDIQKMIKRLWLTELYIKAR